MSVQQQRPSLFMVTSLLGGLMLAAFVLLTLMVAINEDDRSIGREIGPTSIAAYAGILLCAGLWLGYRRRSR